MKEKNRLNTLFGDDLVIEKWNQFIKTSIINTLSIPQTLLFSCEEDEDKNFTWRALNARSWGQSRLYRV